MDCVLVSVPLPRNPQVAIINAIVSLTVLNRANRCGSASLQNRFHDIKTRGIHEMQIGPAESRKVLRVVFLVVRSFLFLLSIATVAKAADYYVSPTGNDSNSGTSSVQPWRTINKVNNKQFSPGDRILFQGGRSFSGTLSFDSLDSGSLISPITVTSYGTDAR